LSPKTSTTAHLFSSEREFGFGRVEEGLQKEYDYRLILQLHNNSITTWKSKTSILRLSKAEAIPSYSSMINAERKKRKKK